MLLGRRRLVIGAIILVALLVATTSYEIFIHRASAAVSANLQVITGSAQVEHSGSTAFTTAITGTQLGSGDSVRTNADSLAAIHYPDGSLTRLAASSTVQVKTLAKTSAGGFDISLDQTAGKTWNEVKQLVNGSHFSVTAPNSSTAEVRGTTFSIVLSIVNGLPVVTVDVWDGSLSVKKADGTPVTVNTGQQAIITSTSSNPTVQNIPESDKQDSFTVYNKTADTSQGNAVTIIGPGTINPGETTSLTQGATADGNTDLDFGLGWGGSSLELCVFGPDGTLYECLVSDAPPLHIVIPDAEAGSWSFTVRAVVLDKPESWYLIVGATSPTKIPAVPFFSTDAGQASGGGCVRNVKAGEKDSWSVNARSGSGKPSVTVDGVPVSDKWTQTKYGTFKNDKGNVSLNFAPVLGVDPAAVKVVVTATSKGGDTATFDCTEDVIAPQLSTLSGTVNGGGQGFVLTLDDAWTHSTPVTTDQFAKYSFDNERGGDYKLTLTLPSGCTLPAGAPALAQTPHLDGTNPVTQDFAVNCPGTTPPTPTSGPPPQGTFGGRYSYQYTSTGGAQPVTWQKISGILPPGLVLDPTGALHGTPDSSAASVDPTFVFTVMPTSASGINGLPITQSITIQPQPQITFSPTEPSPPNAPQNGFLLLAPPGEVSVPYSQAFGVVGGIAPYSWSVSGGSMPGGLALGSTGSSVSLSGAPAAAITGGLVQVRVTDATGAIADGQVELFVFPAPTYTHSSSFDFNPSGLFELDAGRYVNASLGFRTFSDFTSAGTLSLVSGALPSCMALNSFQGEGVGYEIRGTADSTCLGTFIFVVRVTDALGGHADSIPLTMKINPAMTFNAPPIATVNSPYTWTITGGGGHPGNTPTISTAGSLPAGLNVIGVNGTSPLQIGGTPTGPPGDYAIYLNLTDSVNGQTSFYYTPILHIDGALLIITTSLGSPNADQNHPYLGDTLTAAGGQPPYTWTLLGAPTPPTGLAVDATGNVGGTISSAPGSYSFAVTVCDSVPMPNTACVNNSTSPYAMTVNGAPSLAVTVQPWPHEKTFTYAASTDIALSSSGGTACYANNSTGLPYGMYTVNTGCNTGYVAGAPTTAGSYPITLYSVDGQGVQSNVVSGTLIVDPSGPPSIVPFTGPPTVAPGGAQGTPYTFNLGYGSGGSEFDLVAFPNEYYQWTVSPSLPAGMAITPTGFDAVLSGMPGAVSPVTTYTLTIHDSVGAVNAAPFTFSFGVQAKPPILDQMPTGGDVGIPYSFQFTSTLGGTAPFTWQLFTCYCTAISVSSSGFNGVPPGLTLASSGLLSGTPTTAGSYIFFAQVTDALGTLNSGPVTIAISDPTLTVANPAAVPHQGIAYSDSFSVTGGTNPYTWKLTSGSPPPGLTFDKFGHITGSPTGAPGTSATFTVQVTDLAGSTATSTVTLTVG